MKVVKDSKRLIEKADKKAAKMARRNRQNARGRGWVES